ncbi:cytochrome b561 and DOMON domain-containing protein At5g35735 [Amborella trichopoda]|uniref:cytochrome b561 and DOMON domain-containing protein At5g35735 n=1 Tax=Amborella trichopoda TaxID=13333 RepID=UPI0009C17B6F|nr:cytochrome b561 and DOMON domain-containing protein At5g35735 [Amborella trichopoda]|eukprot:XP_020524013.1 cytochrome b561 and DOMON domain-containing protein At5g35735 [Amborella trichopoda]
MASYRFLLFLVHLLMTIPEISQSKPMRCDCGSFPSTFAKNNLSLCKNLREFDGVFGWKIEGGKIGIGFKARKAGSTGWVAWGVNFQLPIMVGTQAIAALPMANGSIQWQTYNLIPEYTLMGNPLPLAPAPIEITANVTEIQNEGGFITLFATISHHRFHDENYTINHLWQVGSRADDIILHRHPMSLKHFDSRERLDLMSGETLLQSSTHRINSIRTVHGVLNVVGWGILLPTGLLFPRYFREGGIINEKQDSGQPIDNINKSKKKKWWLAAHVTIQLTGSILGTGGWIIGLLLASWSKGYHFVGHRVLGIMIFIMACLQGLAPLQRPNKDDEKYYRNWTIYHHFMGYSLISIIIVNIYKGFRILDPPIPYQWAYYGVLFFIGALALLLEIFTWVRFYKSRLILD